MKTTTYYNTNAELFFKQTHSVDMSSIYEVFLSKLQAQGRILDLGCGSGRDLKRFHELGYEVVGVDASIELVNLARKFSGLRVDHMFFSELAFDGEFDAVWACASLLHEPHDELGSVLSKIATALKPSGVLYSSFKYGVGERQQGERFFNDMNEHKFTSIIPEMFDLESLEFWITHDRRPGRSEKWLNIIVKKLSE